MPRIREIGDTDATPEQRALFARDEAAFGYVFNTTRISAHQPEIAGALKDFAGVLSEASTLPPSLVSLVRLRVAGINGCPF